MNEPLPNTPAGPAVPAGIPRPEATRTVFAPVSEPPPPASANGSGRGKQSVVPPEIGGWSWGAFLLNWIWGIGNQTYIAFLMFLPIVNIVMPFVLGAKGNKWAWQNNTWNSVEHFKKVQKKWAWAGLIVLLAGIILSVLMFVLIFSLAGKIMSPLTNPAEQFFSDIAGQNTQAAYSLTSKAFQQNYSYGDFQASIKNLPAVVSTGKASFNSVSVVNLEGTVKGTITGKDGTIQPVTVDEVMENGSWKILDFKFSGQSDVAKSNNADLKPAAQTAFQFPSAEYKDFAKAQNSDSLNPSSANPNLTEVGTPHLLIAKDMNGYSNIDLPLYAINLNMPFGWASRGGFDALERIDFYPANSVKSPSDTAPVDLGLKVLDSSGLGATDLKGVMAKVQGIYGNQIFTTDVDESQNAFMIKIVNVNNPALTASSSSYSIYIKSPVADSTIWLDIDLRAPKDEFQKDLGLLGLEYRDIKVDWQSLQDLVKQSEQYNQ